VCWYQSPLLAQPLRTASSCNPPGRHVHRAHLILHHHTPSRRRRAENADAIGPPPHSAAFAHPLALFQHPVNPCAPSQHHWWVKAASTSTHVRGDPWGAPVTTRPPSNRSCALLSCERIERGPVSSRSSRRCREQGDMTIQLLLSMVNIMDLH